MAIGGGAEKTARHGGVPRRRRSSSGQGVRQQVLQLEERMGKVRRGPKGVNDGGVVELTEGGKNNGTAVAVRLAGADTRPRKERRR
jgi:hypothetical protein